MPGGGRLADPFLGDQVKNGLRRGALWAEINQPGEQHAGIEEDAHGQRFRSSSTSAAISTAGRSSAGTVGRATRRRPTFTSRGAEAMRSRRMPSSSFVTSSSAPGDNPARSLTAAGMTTRPALSMVVLMPSIYHFTRPQLFAGMFPDRSAVQRCPNPDGRGRRRGRFQLTAAAILAFGSHSGGFGFGTWDLGFGIWDLGLSNVDRGTRRSSHRRRDRTT